MRLREIVHTIPDPRAMELVQQAVTLIEQATQGKQSSTAAAAIPVDRIIAEAERILSTAKESLSDAAHVTLRATLDATWKKEKEALRVLHGIPLSPPPKLSATDATALEGAFGRRFSASSASSDPSDFAFPSPTERTEFGQKQQELRASCHACIQQSIDGSIARIGIRGAVVPSQLRSGWREGTGQAPPPAIAQWFDRDSIHQAVPLLQRLSAAALDVILDCENLIHDVDPMLNDGFMEELYAYADTCIRERLKTQFHLTDAQLEPPPRPPSPPITAPSGAQPAAGASASGATTVSLGDPERTATALPHPHAPPSDPDVYAAPLLEEMWENHNVHTISHNFTIAGEHLKEVADAAQQGRPHVVAHRYAERANHYGVMQWVGKTCEKLPTLSVDFRKDMQAFLKRHTLEGYWPKFCETWHRSLREFYGDQLGRTTIHPDAIAQCIAYAVLQDLYRSGHTTDLTHDQVLSEFRTITARHITDVQREGATLDQGFHRALACHDHVNEPARAILVQTHQAAHQDLHDRLNGAATLMTEMLQQIGMYYCEQIDGHYATEHPSWHADLSLRSDAHFMFTRTFPRAFDKLIDDIEYDWSSDKQAECVTTSNFHAYRATLQRACARTLEDTHQQFITFCDQRVDRPCEFHEDHVTATIALARRIPAETLDILSTVTTWPRDIPVTRSEQAFFGSVQRVMQDPAFGAIIRRHIAGDPIDADFVRAQLQRFPPTVATMTALLDLHRVHRSAATLQHLAELLNDSLLRRTHPSKESPGADAAGVATPSAGAAGVDRAEDTDAVDRINQNKINSTFKMATGAKDKLAQFKVICKTMSPADLTALVARLRQHLDGADPDDRSALEKQLDSYMKHVSALLTG